MLTGIIGPVGPAYGKPRLREPTGDYFEGGNHQPSLRETIDPVGPAYGKPRLREPTGDNLRAGIASPACWKPSVQSAQPTGRNGYGNQRETTLRPRITSPAHGNQREPTGDNFEAENYQPSPREPTGTNGR